jgi:hypothetical protein
VLRPEGVLLISVPYFSPLRRVVSLMRSSWRRVSCPRIDGPDERIDRRFFQYAYTRREFKGILAASRFHVVSTQGYGVIWGLYDLPLVKRVMRAWGQRCRDMGSASSSKGMMSTPIHCTNGEPPPPSLLKRLVVSEDASVPVAGLIVRTLRWACANMMMYVCVRSPDHQMVMSQCCPI